MHVDFRDKKFVTSPNIDGENGSFSIETPIGFEKCRERFAISFTEDLHGFYFLHQPGRGEAVASFVTKTEKVLEVTASGFAMTNRERITWVEPSAFWRSCAMRRSLLTCLLRAGTVYDRTKDNYEESLFSEPYLGRTRKAVMRFLFGFTRYVGPAIEVSFPSSTIIIKGWLSVYEFRDEEFVKETLLLPAGVKGFTSSINLGNALWF